MVSAEDFVDGTSVSWGRLGTGLGGSVLLAVVLGITETFQTVFGGLIDLVDDGGDAIAGLVEQAVGIVLAAYQTGLQSFDAATDVLGPLAFLIGVISVVGILWVTQEVVDRVGI